MADSNVEKRVTLGKMAVVAALMFSFAYALIPIYKKICEVTGLNQITRKQDGADALAANTQIDRTRKVVVEFDANSRGAWLFKPKVASLEVHPGEVTSVTYSVESTLDRDSIGQAIPSYAPNGVGRYFVKLDCFCFKQQTLPAKQVREFPVVFVVDPKLPADVTTITLSYTFFEPAGLSAIGKPRGG